jgi:ABC-type amino acid transport substrate-binding protein
VRRIDRRSRRHRVAACLAAAISFAGSAPVAPAAAQDTARLRLCADPDNLPFSSAQPGPPGFYVELGSKLASAMGRSFEPIWVPTFYTKRQVRQKLLSGQCDGFLGLPDDASFMGPRLIFSASLLTMGYALVAPVSAGLRTPADLHGRRVAVQFASPPQNLLAGRDDVTTVTVDTPEAAMQDLAEGRADVAFIWGPSAGWLNRTLMHGAYRVEPVADAHMQWSAGIAFARDQTDLRDAVNAALSGLHADIERLAAAYAFPDAASRPAAIAVASADAVEAGRKLFNENCSHCHGPDAVQGEQRRNLRLLRQRYGDAASEMFMTTVTHGRVSKGMPNWSGIISKEEFEKIFAFLASVQEAGSE